MTFLLELKEKFRDFYARTNLYLVPLVKYVVALAAFLMLNSSIGYMESLKNPIIAILLALVCAFTPNGVTIAMLSVFMLIHLYAISMEFALVALCVVLIMYLLYFRFTPRAGYLLIITIIMCWLDVPYLLPIAFGLCGTALNAIPTVFGVIIYYIVKTASEYETAISGQDVTDSMQQISYLVESMIGSKQMLVIIIAMAVTIVVVYIIRRMRVDHSWTYAIVVGTILQMILLIVGEILFDTKLNLILIIIGCVLGAILGYICNVLFFSLDYKRTEYVQYEDDEYYYYVKAIPKISFTSEDVRVKQINAKKTKRTDDNNIFMND